MHSVHSILACALALITVGASPPTAGQETAASPPLSPNVSSFTIFVRSVSLGSEQISLERTADGWTISSSGYIGAPIDVAIRRLQLRYDPEWKPLELTLDASVRGQLTSTHTTVSGTTVRSEMRIADQPSEATDTIEETAALLTNPFFAAYEALSMRLRTAAPGTAFQTYLAPHEPMALTVGESTREQIRTLARVIDARRTSVTIAPPGNPPLELQIWGDEEGRLLRVSIPAESIEVVREDIGAVTSRRITVTRTNDEEVRIPATGFSLAGTVSKPADSGNVRLPAIVFVGGSGQTDRDETVADIPIFGQLAGALADAGFLVLRYDKRGVGQSGGRPEAAALVDYAEDLRAAVRMLRDRRDVDRGRIAVLAHGEGGPVGMLAAARENRIRALVLVAAPGVTGEEFTMAQTMRTLDRSNRSEAEKQATIEFQKSIHEAVRTGEGWEKIPPGFRRQAETPLFRSFLAFDPAKVVSDIDQPILVVQGMLDTQVDPSNADRLEALARARRRSRPLEVVRLPGINHLLVSATTGEVDEYRSLRDRPVSPDVGNAIAEWFQKTIPNTRR